jgi:beta-N-acetylhexosaminidase
LGPLVIDFRSKQLLPEEKRLLRHPLVGGVILFTRNFQHSEQLRSLTAEIADIRPDCLICVDHEGGRVQRFRTHSFTQLPAMGQLSNEEHAFDCGIVMAYELKTHGIHVNFAPVLDRDAVSQVIGDRGFSAKTDVIASFAQALIAGMTEMNMPACGKHFPGHGSVVADSHIACPVDDRGYADISHDMQPFEQLIRSNKLGAVMPAHVVYSALDRHPAGYSSFWLQHILKQKLKFNGVIFSDDLSMEGASISGTYPNRALTAYQAGCDFLLLCNAPEQISPVLNALEKISLRQAPNCNAWFKPLPSDARQRYESALHNLQRVYKTTYTSTSE